MGSQSETLAIYIKITYLNKELWNIFQYRPQWAQLCQHVWASRNISVHFQIKYLASFLSPYQIHIFKTRKNDVFDVGKQYFCLSKHCDQLRSQRAKPPDSRNSCGWYPLKMDQITRASPAELRIVRAIWRCIGYTTICASNRYIFDQIKKKSPFLIQRKMNRLNTNRY